MKRIGKTKEEHVIPQSLFFSGDFISWKAQLCFKLYINWSPLRKAKHKKLNNAEKYSSGNLVLEDSDEKC